MEILRLFTSLVDHFLLPKTTRPIYLPTGDQCEIYYDIDNKFQKNPPVFFLLAV